MKKFFAVLFATFFLASSAHAYMWEGGATITLNGYGITGVSCYYGADGHCPPMTLAWNKGTTSYVPYALYRLRSDNMGGGDGISLPGYQMACPVLGVGSTTIVPTITTMGATGVYRYVLVYGTYPGHQTCTTIDSTESWLAEVDLTLYPAP